MSQLFGIGSALSALSGKYDTTQKNDEVKITNTKNSTDKKKYNGALNRSANILRISTQLMPQNITTYRDTTSNKER